VNYHFGFAIEAMVSVLLLLTILYCVRLNKQLRLLKADEQSLRVTISELVTATEIAERAIGGLKHAVRDVNDDLGSQLTAATEMSRTLTKQLAEGDDVLRRLAKIAAAARPAPPIPAAPVVAPEPPRVSAVRATVAAAQAFAERRRAAGLAA
jgi:hypothetical protein